MKKKLNIFCVLLLVLMAAQFVVSFVYLSGDMSQAFREGWQDGHSETNSITAKEGIMAIVALIAGIGSVCSKTIVNSSPTESLSIPVHNPMQ